MDNFLKDFILKSNSKALATLGNDGVNVVPVSTVFIEEDKIILINYFMDKTLKNILSNNEVSLAVWKDLYGYQIKALCDYKEKGELFEKICLKVKEILPERIVKGILILTPQEIIDIAPTKDTKEHFLLMI